MSKRTVLMNAFNPDTELYDPDRFAGRSQQVRELVDSLHANGSTPLIYGDRGLGKSSLALQLQLIAMGNVELLHQIGAERLALPEGRHYLTLYVTCTDLTQTFTDLLQALVNAAESVELVQTAVGANHLVDRTTRKKLSLKFVELESSNKYATESERLSYQELNLEEKLVDLCELLTTAYEQPVLFIIDELDRMSNTRGLASFLKAASSPNLKFMLVGIASNVSALLTDHQSLERRLVPVQVPLMERVELEQIVSKAETHLKATGIGISFSPRAKTRLATVASGFPWFVHALGQRCLVEADDANRSMIHYAHVQRAISGVVKNRLSQQFSDLYQKAVRDSEPREITLRAFAHWMDADIPTGEVYRILNQDLGIKTGSVYRGHLCKPEYGEILFAPAFQARGLVRFKNEMFKAYVRMRPSIYDAADKTVQAAYRRRDERMSG